MSSKNQKYSTKIKKIVNFIIKNVKPRHWNYRSKLIKTYLKLILKETSWLQNTKLNERFYCILNNIFEKPKCSHCGEKYVNYKHELHGYQKYCGYKCSANSEKTQIKKKETNFKKFGFEYASQSPVIQQEMSNAWKIKTEEDIQKITQHRKSVKKEKYDDENYNNRPLAKKTNLKRYNVDNPFKYFIFIEKGKQKKLELYEDENYNNRPKFLKTMYDENRIYQNNREAYVQTMLKRYNVINGFLLSIKRKGYSKQSQILFWNIYKQLKKELQEKTYFGELNQEFGKKDNINNKYYMYDFVISSLKICIEFNGEHVHPNPSMTNEEWCKWSTPYKNNKMNADEKYKYDQEKLDILRDQGFKVLEVWSNDFKNNPNIVLKLCLDFILKKI